MFNAKIHKGPCNVVLPNGNTAQFFKSYPAVLLKDLKSSDDVAVHFDDNDIIHTGKYEKYEHGKYEIILIKAGTQVDINITPNNEIHIMAPKSRTSIKSNVIQGVDFNFVILTNNNANTINNTNNTVATPTTPTKVETKYKL